MKKTITTIAATLFAVISMISLSACSKVEDSKIDSDDVNFSFSSEVKFEEKFVTKKESTTVSYDNPLRYWPYGCLNKNGDFVEYASTDYNLYVEDDIDIIEHELHYFNYDEDFYSNFVKPNIITASYVKGSYIAITFCDFSCYEDDMKCDYKMKYYVYVNEEAYVEVITSKSDTSMSYNGSFKLTCKEYEEASLKYSSKDFVNLSVEDAFQLCEYGSIWEYDSIPNLSNLYLSPSGAVHDLLNK